MKVYKLLALVGIVCVAVGLMSGGKSDRDIKSRVVKLVNAQGSCSGTQVHAPSGADYILTAGHCNVLEEDGSITVITEDGRQMSRKVIFEDPTSDLLILEGIPGMRGLDIAESSYSDQHVRTFTHGAGLATYQTDGRLIQPKRIQVLEAMAPAGTATQSCAGAKHKLIQVPTVFGIFDICTLDVVETVSTALTVPGSSGGLVADDSGDLVGVVSAGGGDFHYFVTLWDIRALVRNY